MSHAPLSACLIPLVHDPEHGWSLFWAKRHLRRSFLGGFHAFLGGGLEPADCLVASDPLGQLASCAAREGFEEAGFWCGALGDEPAEGVRVALAAGEVGWEQVVRGRDWGQRRLVPLGRWTTPEWAEVRYETEFFGVQMHRPGRALWGALEEAGLGEGEWISAARALAEHMQGGVLLSAPTVAMLRHLVVHAGTDRAEKVARCNQSDADALGRAESVGGVYQLPLRSPTLPPATHTNCCIVAGGQAFVVVDPGSQESEEMAKVWECVELLVAQGLRWEAVILTHHHLDHVCGVPAILERARVPVWAHRACREALGQMGVGVDRELEEGDRLDLGQGQVLRVVWTPGHAQGHIALWLERSGICLCGDVVASRGTILIQVPDGHMGQYLSSLRRLRDLEPKALVPAHGEVIADPKAHLEGYIAHREAREEKVFEAIASWAGGGGVESGALVSRVYDDVDPAHWPLAQMSLQAHLEHLCELGRVQRMPEGGYEVRGV